MLGRKSDGTSKVWKIVPMNYEYIIKSCSTNFSGREGSVIYFCSTPLISNCLISSRYLNSSEHMLKLLQRLINSLGGKSITCPVAYSSKP